MSTRRNSTRGDDLAERVRSVLASKSLTLSRVSQASAARFGRSSPYFLPHTLYHEFRLGTFTPSLHQVFALSQICGYKFSDWLLLLGCDLEDIPRLQVRLPSKRTMLLDSSLVDADAWTPWFQNRSSSTTEPSIAPLARLLEVTGQRRLRFLSEIVQPVHLYVKIGREDALAFPDLAPGSIGRVNPRFSNTRVPRTNGSTSAETFLLIHSKGLFCCRLRIAENGMVIPIGTLLSYAQVEMKVPRDARILGIVDLEIRSTLRVEQPEVPKDLARHWRPRPLVEERTVGQLLRAARMKSRLSLREVAALSHKIADLFDDRRYAISPSSLCDYEQSDTPPRHFHKAVSLCSLYGLDFRRFLKAIGIAVEEGGTEPMPDHLARRAVHEEPLSSDGNNVLYRNGFLKQMVERCEEIPFFLRQSIGELSGLEDPSLDDWFWIGGAHDVLHPLLTNGLFAIVNRRDRRPIHFTSKPAWEQPVYVIQLRNGTYLCACCGIENGTLVIHPYSDRFRRSERLRYHHDAEVVGRIVTIARKLG